MSSLSKIELKKQLRNIGIKVVEGNYVRKADIKKVLSGENDDLNAIREQVSESFSKKEMDSFTSFNDFFDQVDVLNAYDEEWTLEFLEEAKPLYKKVWDEYKADIKCECGGDKTRTGHSTWCPKYQD